MRRQQETDKRRGSRTRRLDQLSDVQGERQTGHTDEATQTSRQTTYTDMQTSEQASTSEAKRRPDRAQQTSRTKDTHHDRQTQR